jgi:hypothetical protein
MPCCVVLCCVVADEDSSPQPFDLLPLPLPFRVIPVARQGSEPIAEAATSSVYTTTAGDGGGSGRAGATAAVMQRQAAPELEGGGRLTQ